MRCFRDNVAASMLFVIGMGIILHINSIFKQELKEVKSVQDAKLTRQVPFETDQ